MRNSIIILGLLVLAALIFLRYGRSLYMPLITTLKGKETVQSVYEKIVPSVEERLSSNLLALNIDGWPDKLVFVGLKEERILEVYAIIESEYFLVKRYPFTAFSGVIGPKLLEGDKQIPEGIYFIEYLNPNSAYYLSMKVNYPNEFDREKALIDGRNNLGGDIFIHGKDATIGCIPIGDTAIEELFVLASNAMNNGVKVLILPWDFRLRNDYPVLTEVDWENELYDQLNKELLLIKVN